jgi:xanthine/uracil/vitamin C permease (AzgA family)
MAQGKIGLMVWLILVTALWALHPILLAPARGIVVLAATTGLLALCGWIGGTQVLVFWSGIVGLLNITLALILAAHPPSLWTGLSAGLALLALLDGSQRYAYVRHCHVEPGVLSSMIDTFIRLSSLSIVAGLVVGGILVSLSPHLRGLSLVSLLTLAGAALFAGAFAIFLLHSNRPSGG